MSESQKRRKLSNGHAHHDRFSSDDFGSLDESDLAKLDTLNENDDDTMRTLFPPTMPQGTQPTQLLNNYTQPTQLLDPAPSIPESPIRQAPSHIQVPASSPPPESPQQTVPLKRPSSFASTLAPPGTAFRQPVIARKFEGPKYRSYGSDDEKPKPQPKPSLLNNNVTKAAGLKSMPAQRISTPFSDLMASATYKGGSSSDSLANAYSRPVQRPSSKPPVARASTETKIETLDDISDYSWRKKIEHMRAMLPDYTIQKHHRALTLKKGNETDALDWLMSGEGDAIDLTKDSSQVSKQSSPRESQIAAPLKRPQAKQTVQPLKSIQEKYAQKKDKPIVVSSSPITSPVRVEALPVQIEAEKEKEKPRRRLMQGRRRQSTSPAPVPLEVEVEAPAPKAGSVRSVSPDFNDSAVQTGDDEPVSVSEDSLLKFFNECDARNLADLATIPESTAQLVISKRPFRNLDQVRDVHEGPTEKVKGKRGHGKRAIGIKIVDACERMWTGYQAVDALVEHCEELGKPLAEEMTRWGVNVFGNSSGELDLVNFDSVDKDSGIGTPASTRAGTDDDEDVKIVSASTKKSSLFKQPSIMNPKITLKDYQVVGINWLALLFRKRLSCILADDMGLGKTCQVIAFLAHLQESGFKGPHVVIVPGSTLENWLREFQHFCPALNMMPYYGSQKERPTIRENIVEIEPDVIVTTYDIAKVNDDRKFLKSLKPCVCVFDEGHMLKNSKSQKYQQLMRIPAQFRLLLTGTPLQNNLGELCSLLGFILPKVFNEHQEDLEAIFSHRAKTTDQEHIALLSAQRIARARSMMTPFVLRRKKHQVLKHLPAKTRRVEYCEMTPAQKQIYDEEKEKALQIARENQSGKKTTSGSANNMMQLRKAAIHPLLFRRHYTDAILRKISRDCLPDFPEANPELVFQDLEWTTDMEMHRWCNKYKSVSKYVLHNDEWLDSGKVSALIALVKQFKKSGDRVLVFSQFTMVMDVLEEVFETLQIKFSRLDGTLAISARQDLIDRFYEDESITVFMLSTKAGGAGINLACANKVIIFDSSFNPQDDIQAENRAHRVGQTREVEVIRLVTKGTIEEAIFALGESKLKLDERVAGEELEGGGEEDGAKRENDGAKKVEEMLLAEAT